MRAADSSDRRSSIDMARSMRMKMYVSLHKWADHGTVLWQVRGVNQYIGGVQKICLTYVFHARIYLRGTDAIIRWKNAMDGRTSCRDGYLGKMSCCRGHACHLPVCRQVVSHRNSNEIDQISASSVRKGHIRARPRGRVHRIQIVSLKRQPFLFSAAHAKALTKRVEGSCYA